MKKFCEDCKYLISTCFSVGMDIPKRSNIEIVSDVRKGLKSLYCVAPIGDCVPRIENTWLRAYSVNDLDKGPHEPHKLNANNDCEYYTPKRCDCEGMVKSKNNICCSCCKPLT